MKIIQGNGQDISVFIKSHQNDMKSSLESPGAILLRDFHCPTDVEVDNLSRDLGYIPSDTYIPGTAPRKAYKKGNSFVFTSTEAPPHLPILPHTEMTYWPNPPDLLIFQCKSIDTDPTQDGGETVIFDNTAAAGELDQELLDKLERGCIWKRFYPGHFNPKWDVADSIAGGSCWQKAFATENPKNVEMICKKNGVHYEWVSNSDSGGPNFPNLITHVHLPWCMNRCLILQTAMLGKVVYHDIIKRFPSRFDNQKVHESVNSESVAPKFELLQPDDGKSAFLNKNEMLALMEAIWKHAIFVRWKKGDVLIINNKKMAHARMNVTGQRKIVVAMASKSRTL